MSPPFARKRFAQHFLTQPGIAERIVGLAGLRSDSVVLEIGPGRGALTRLLAPRCKRLLAVEVDRDLSDALRGDFAAQPGVEVINADILDVDLSSLTDAGPVTVVANLPYNISTPVLMRLLDLPEHFDRMVLMLQREVAERIGAAPGSKTYGGLSVVVQVIADVRIGLHVPASAFAPRPKVDSAVVLIAPRRPTPLTAAERRQLRYTVRTAFSRRRKQLANVIAPLTADPRAVLSHLGLDPRQRPETLTPADFVRLAAALKGTTDEHR